jgi:hypothetical protein
MQITGIYMRPILFYISIVLLLNACANTGFKKDKAAFENAKTIRSFKSVADMNDSYFTIRENDFFEFYKVLYGSEKNSSYPGKFTRSGDTMLLHFYNKKGYELLGRKALIDKANNEIVFFDNFPGVKKRLLVN